MENSIKKESDIVKEKIIVTSLSLINKVFDDSDYYIDGEKVGSFRFTNEPVLSYLLSKYNNENIKVIEFCSREVLNNNVIIDEKELTTLNYYNTKFSITNPSIVEYDNVSIDTQKCIKDLIDILSAMGDNPKELYVDISGGLRDFTTVLVSLCDYLSFKNIEIKEIFSTTLPRESIDGKGKINHSDIKEILNFSRAITRFTQDGNSRKLVECLGEDSNDLKEQLTNYSNDVILNDLYDFSKHYDELKKGLSDWKKRYDDSSSHSIIDTCFYHSIDQIVDKLYMDDNENDIYSKEPSLKLLRWCLDNDLLIQALAIYDEKIPELYYKYNIISDEFFDCIGIDVDSSEIPLGKNDKQFFYLSQPKERKLYISMLKDFVNKYFYDSDKPGVYIGNNFDIDSEFSKINTKPYYGFLKVLDNRVPNFIDNFCTDLKEIKAKKDSNLSANIDSLYNKAFSRRRSNFYVLTLVKVESSIVELHNRYDHIVNIRNSKVHINDNLNVSDSFDSVKNKLKQATDMSVNELKRSIDLMSGKNKDEYAKSARGEQYEYSNLDSKTINDIFDTYRNWNTYFNAK